MNTESAPVQTVLALYTALRDSQLKDVLALCDPDVTCRPLLRPARSVYYRFDGMARLINDMHAAHGQYQVRIDSVTEKDGRTITVQATIIPEPARNEPPLPVTTVYTLHNGLITAIESWPGHIAT